MKKFFLIAAMFAASVAGANADSKLVIPSVDEAQANGWRLFGATTSMVM